MSRILFAWELGEGLGHVTVQRALALGLAERGHDVLLAARNVRSARTAFSDTGLAYVQCPYQTWRPPPIFQPLRSYAHLLHSVSFNSVEGLISLLSAWQRLFDLFDPDLIVFDHSPTALLASRTRGAKRALVGSGFFGPPPVSPLPSLRPGERVSPDLLARDEATVLALVNDSLRRTGASELSRLADLYAQADLSVLATYEELDHFGPRSGVRYWGVQASCPAVTPTWPEGIGKRIYGYLKPMPGLSELLGTLGTLGAPVLVYGSWVNDEAVKRFGTRTLRLERQPLDLQRVAEECDLAILNGTHGTTAELLLRGVPVLQLPIFVEQALTAARTAELGAGLMFNSKETTRVAAGLNRMLSGEEYREAAGRFASKYAGTDSTAIAAQIVEALDSLVG